MYKVILYFQAVDSNGRDNEEKLYKNNKTPILNTDKLACG